MLVALFANLLQLFPISAAQSSLRSAKNSAKANFDNESARINVCGCDTEVIEQFSVQPESDFQLILLVQLNIQQQLQRDERQFKIECEPSKRFQSSLSFESFVARITR